MTKREIKVVHDQCTHRITANLNNSEKLLLDSDFNNQSRYKTLAAYIRAVITGKVINRKSTIFNTPSINLDSAKQIKGIATNINQLLAHLNHLRLERAESTSDYDQIVMDTVDWLVDLHKLLKSSLLLIDNSDINIENIRDIARHLFKTDDYLDLLSVEKLQELIKAKENDEYAS